MSETQKTTLFLSLYGADESEGCIVITATIGAVKTTIRRMILENVARKSQSAWPLNRFTSENDLLESILQNFDILGKDNRKRNKKRMIYQLTQLLLNDLNAGERALLVIEDGQNLPLSVSDQTRIISSLETEKEKLVQIILAGENAQIQDLKSPKLEKCTYIFPHGPISDDKIKKYIEHRLMNADSPESIRFSPEALNHIRENSFGIPCITNLIFDNDLAGYYTQQNIETKEEIVENVVENITVQRGERLREGALPKKRLAWATSIAGMRMALFTPAIVAMFVTTGAIGFFISQNIMDKKILTHTLKDQDLYYSQNIMGKKNLEHQPEQELPVLQEKKVDMQEETEKKEELKRAVSHQKSGELLKAKRGYLELLKRYPKDHEIHNNLGSVYLELGNFDNAITEYRKAINLNPNYCMARNNLGLALYKKGDLQAAMKEFYITREINPKDVQCITLLGVLSKKLKNPDRARKFFEEALIIDPTYPEAHYNLAVIFEADDVEKAAYHFQKFLDYGTGSKYRFLEKEAMERLDDRFNSSSR